MTQGLSIVHISLVGLAVIGFHIFARRSVFHYFHLGAQVGNCS